LFAELAVAQKECNECISNPETTPQFPGGLIAQQKFINDNFIYPAKAKENGIEGNCYVSFVIDTLGKINNINVIKGIKNCIECDDEAKRLFSIMPNWIPSKVNGKPKECRMNYPLKFRMK
jgi:protein TonB